MPALRTQTVRLQITNKTAYAQKKDALDRYIAAYRETLDWMYSDPAALKMYSEWVKIPEPITKRMRDEFYLKDELLPDRLSGIDAITEEAVAYKYLKAPLSKAQLKELFVYSKAFDYAKYCPPLAESVEPVIRPASSEARNTTQRAISSGSPRRPIGICGRMFFSSTSFGTACTISVLM